MKIIVTKSFNFVSKFCKLLPGLIELNSTIVIEIWKSAKKPNKQTNKNNETVLHQCSSLSWGLAALKKGKKKKYGGH